MKKIKIADLKKKRGGGGGLTRTVSLPVQALLTTFLHFSENWKCWIYEITVSLSHGEGKSQNIHARVKSKAFRSYHKFSSLYECE